MNTTRKERFIQKATRLTVKVLLFSLLLSLFLYACIGASADAPNAVAEATAGTYYSTTGGDIVLKKEALSAGYFTLDETWGTSSYSSYWNYSYSNGNYISYSPGICDDNGAGIKAISDNVKNGYNTNSAYAYINLVAPANVTIESVTVKVDIYARSDGSNGWASADHSTRTNFDIVGISKTTSVAETTAAEYGDRNGTKSSSITTGVTHTETFSNGQSIQLRLTGTYYKEAGSIQKNQVQHWVQAKNISISVTGYYNVTVNTQGIGSIAASDASGASYSGTTAKFTKTTDSIKFTATPTDSKYVFTGWSDGNTDNPRTFTGAGVTPGGTYTAIFEERAIVAYDANGGVGTEAWTAETKYTTITLRTDCPYTRDGYYFAGWGTSAISTTPVTSVTTGAGGETTRVYAIWKGINYTITYKANGGTGSVEQTTGTFNGDDAPLADNSFVRTDRFFMGWDVDENATSTPNWLIGKHPNYSVDKDTMGSYLTALQNGNIKTSSVSFTLYAIWTPALEFGSYSGRTGKWGTEGNPYVIRNITHFNNLRNIVNGNANATGSITGSSLARYTNPQATSHNYSGAFFELAASLDIGGETVNPIGTSTNNFRGTFDGLNKTISNYSIPAGQYGGLFGYISGATLRNFTVNPGTINGNATDKGAVVGYMTNSTLSGITTSGGYVWGHGYTGGIVGRAEGTSSIINCTNLGTKVYNNGKVAGTGGILGYANGTITVTGCKNYGTTSTTDANNNTTYNVFYSKKDARDGWGGIVGYSASMLTLSGCENRASLIWKEDSTGHNNFYAIGGIVGKMNNGSISSSKNFGNIYGGKLTGGIVGEVIGGATVSQCYNAGPVQTWGSGTYSYHSSAGTYVGGIAGASRGTIEYCYSIGTVTDSSGKGFAGGITAATEGNINYCYSVATISSKVDAPGVGNLLGHSPNVVNVGTSWAFFSGAVPSTSNTCQLDGSTWIRGRAAVLPSSIATASIPSVVVPVLGNTPYSSWEQITEHKFDGFGLTFTTNPNCFVQAVNLTTSKVAGYTPIDASFVSSSASIDGTTSTSVSNQITLSMGFSANIDQSHAGLYIDPSKEINASINSKTYDATSGAPVLGTGNAGSQARFLYYHGGKWQTTAPINAGEYPVAVEVISNGGVIGRQTGLSYTIAQRELTVTYGVSDGWAAYTYNAAHQGVTFVKVDNLPTELTDDQKETVFKVISNGTDSVLLEPAHSPGALQYNARNAIRVGSYSINVILSDTSNYTLTGLDAESYSWTIDKRELTLTATYENSQNLSSYVYSAGHQGVNQLKISNFPTNSGNQNIVTVETLSGYTKPSVTQGAQNPLVYNISGAVNVGNYGFVVTLKDTHNYTLKYGSTTSATHNFSWTIDKRELTLTATYENGQNLSSYVYSAGHQGVNQLKISNFPTNSGNQNIVTVETLSGYTKPSVTQGAQNPLVYNISGAVNVGNYGFVVTLKDTHNYTLKYGSTTSATHNFSWVITQKPVSDADIIITWNGHTNLEYNGRDQIATATVVWKSATTHTSGANCSGSDMDLVLNYHYNRSVSGDTVNVTAEGITITITGIGNFTGTATLNYKIAPYDLVAHILTTRDAFIYYGGTAFGAPSKNETYGWDMYPFVNLTDSNGSAVLDAGITSDAQIYDIVYSAERFKLVTNLGQSNPNLITAGTTLTDGEVFDSINASTGVSRLTTITWEGTQNYTGTITVKFVVVNSDFGVKDGADTEAAWGSAENPYVISHWIHLLRLSEIVNQISAPINSVQNVGAGNSANARSKDVFYTAYLDGTIKKSYFLVTANITMPDYVNFKPIGGWSAIANQDGATTFYSYENNASYYFGGVFDGNFASGAYATIKLGNHFSALNGDYVGLFGVMKGVVLNGTVAHAEVKNVDVLSADASNAYYNVKGAQYVGVIVGKAQEYVIIDRAYANTGLNNSNKDSVTVSGTNFVGSVVGHLGLGSEMYGEYVNYAKVSGSSYVGGIIGQIMAGAGRQGTGANAGTYYLGEYTVDGVKRVSSMTNYGSVVGSQAYTGGVIGAMTQNVAPYDGVITVFEPTFIRNEANVTGLTFVGGLVGRIDLNNAIRLINTEDEGQANWSYNGSIDSTIYEITTNTSYAGGLFGVLSTMGHQIDSVFSTAVVKTSVDSSSNEGNYIGGLVGYMNGGTFRYSFVSLPGNQNVNATTDMVHGNNYVGGLVGNMALGTLDTCYVQGFKYDNNLTTARGGVAGVAATVATIKDTWALYLTADPTYESVPANAYGKYILSFDGAMSATIYEMLVFAGLIPDSAVRETSDYLRATGTTAGEITAQKGSISIGITTPTTSGSTINDFDTKVQVVFYDGSGYQEAYADAFEDAANDSTNNLFIRLSASSGSVIIAKTGVRFGSVTNYTEEEAWEAKYVGLSPEYQADVTNPIDNTAAGTYDGEFITQYMFSRYPHTLISDNIGNSRETLSNLFDGDVTTKFCYGTTSQTFVIDLSTSVYVSGYRWATANDTLSFPTRNPSSFIIEGSDNNSTWTTLVEDVNDKWTKENYTWVNGKAFTNPGSYRYIRVTVSSSGSPIQLSEFIVGNFVNTSRQITFNFKKYSEVAPRVIDTLDDWKAFALDVQNSGTSGLNQYVKLAADITVPTKYTSGGNVYSGLAGLESTDNINAHNFRGTFDGDGYTITVDIVGGNNTSSAGNVASSYNELGLFPQASNATFQNLTIAGSISTTGNDIGAFVGIARGPLTFYNCVNKATVYSSGHNVGGLVGTANSKNVTFIGCVNQGEITAESNYYDEKQGSAITYSVLVIDYGVGGILGSTGTQTGSIVLIDSCRNAGNITGDASVGGIVGACRAAAQITNCGNTGYCHATNDTEHDGADCAVGGIVGGASQDGGANIYACYNSGTIVADGNKAGGIIGTDAEYTQSTRLTQIYHCYNTGDVYTGGLTGHTSNNNYGVQAGGIIGAAIKTEIYYCYNVGKITSNGRYDNINRAHARVGGIAGHASSESGAANTIYRCYNAGPIIIGYNGTTSEGVNRCSYGAGIIGYITASGQLHVGDKIDSNKRINIIDTFSFEYQVRRLHYVGDKTVGYPGDANIPSLVSGTAYRFQGAVLYTETCSTSGNYLKSLDEMTCIYDETTGLVRPKNDAVYRAFGENGKAPTILNSYKDGTVDAAQLRQGLDDKEAGGYVFVYGCLPQLAAFALDTQDGLAMTSQNYVKDNMGLYHLEKAGSENNPYVIKDGIDLMGINALAQASAGMDGKHIEFANGENNLSGDICQEIVMPDGTASDGVAAADTQNYYKFKNGRTSGYSEGKSYHLFKKGAYCSGLTPHGYLYGESDPYYNSESPDAYTTANGYPEATRTYARANWKNANDYWNGSSWVAGGDLTNVNFYPIGRYYSIKHVWSNNTGGPYNSAFKGYIEGSYDGTNPVVISNVKIALSNVETHSYTGYPTTYEYRDDKGNVINNNSTDVNVPIGLFGFVEDATIANIAVTGTIDAYGSGIVSAGVVGKALGNSRIVGVHAGSATVTTGSSNGKLSVKTYSGEKGYVGGIVGMADSGVSGNRLTIANSVVVNATIIGFKDSIGGIVGYSEGDDAASFTDIVGCHVQKATIQSSSTGTKRLIGGIVGVQGNEGALTVSGCHVGTKGASGTNVTIKGDNSFGGIISFAEAGTNSANAFIDCYVWGDVLIQRQNPTNDSTYGTAIGGIVGYVSDSTDGYATFRGNISFYGTINLGTKGASVTTYDENVGGVVGYMGTCARMEECIVQVSGVVNATNAYTRNVGGFAGISKGVCLDGGFTVAPTLTTTVADNVGGFIGLNEGDTYITRTTTIVTGGQIGAHYNVGGFIGANAEGSALHMGAAEYKGTVYGEDGDSATISLHASVDGKKYIGGFLGYNKGDVFGEYCTVTNNGKVGANDRSKGIESESVDCIGGVFGDNSTGGSISISENAVFVNNGQVGHSSFEIAYQEFVGGIIGVALGDITNNGVMRNTGDVYGYEYVGGAIGGLVNGTISGQLSNGNVVVIHATAESEALEASDEALSTADTGSSSVTAVVNVGGVIGIVMQTAIIDGAVMYNYGHVESSGDGYKVSNLGGAIGLNYGVIQNSKFYNYGTITAKNFAGGALGVSDGVIHGSNFYNYATITFTGDTALGGSVGYITSDYTSHGTAAYYPTNNAALGTYDPTNNAALGTYDPTLNRSQVTGSYFGYESTGDNKVVLQATGEHPYPLSTILSEDSVDNRSAFVAKGGLGGVFGAINSDDMTEEGGWSNNTFFIYGDVYGGVFLDGNTNNFTPENFGGTVDAVGGVIGAIEVAHISISNMLIYKSNVGGKDYVGGIVGYNDNSNENTGAGAAIDNCYNVYGEVIGKTYNCSAISASYRHVGGIVGFVPSSTNPGLINNSSNYNKPVTNASYWIKSYSNEHLQNSNPQDIVNTLDKASTWTEFLSHADYINNVDVEFDEDGNPVYLTDGKTWQNYIVERDGKQYLQVNGVEYVQNANEDWGTYQDVSINYNTGVKATGFYYIFAKPAEGNAQFEYAKEAIQVEHSNSEEPLNRPYTNDQSLNFWLIIANSAGQTVKSYKSDQVAPQVNEGNVVPGYIYSTAYTATKNGYYLYVSDESENNSATSLYAGATDANGNTQVYVSSDASTAGNVMIFYKKAVMLSYLNYNGYERYAPIADVTYKQDMTSGVYGTNYYSFTNDVAGDAINTGREAGTYDVQASIYTVDKVGTVITLGKLDSTLADGGDYQWNIRKRTLEVESTTGDIGEQGETQNLINRYDGTFSHYIKFTVTNFAKDEHLSEANVREAINNMMALKYSFNSSSSTETIEAIPDTGNFLSGSVIPNTGFDESTTHIAYYSTGSDGSSAKPGDKSNTIVGGNYSELGSLQIYKAEYIVFVKKAGKHTVKVEVAGTEKNHSSPKKNSKDYNVDMRDLILDFTYSQGSSLLPTYEFDGGVEWQGIQSVVISGFLVGDALRGNITTVGSTASLLNGDGKANKDNIVANDDNTVTVNFFANNAGTYHAHIEISEAIRNNYRFVKQSDAGFPGSLSPSTNSYEWDASWTINKYVITLENVKIEAGQKLFYNGEEQSPKFSNGAGGTDFVVNHGNEVVTVYCEASISGGSGETKAVNAGTYTVNVTASGTGEGSGSVKGDDSKATAGIRNYKINYTLDDEQQAVTFEIQKREVRLVWNNPNLSYVYSGNAQGLSINDLKFEMKKDKDTWAEYKDAKISVENGKIKVSNVFAHDGKSETLYFSFSDFTAEDAGSYVAKVTGFDSVSGTNDAGSAEKGNYTASLPGNKTYNIAKSKIVVAYNNNTNLDKTFDNTSTVTKTLGSVSLSSQNGGATAVKVTLSNAFFCDNSGNAVVNVGNGYSIKVNMSLSDTKNYEFVGDSTKVFNVGAKITPAPIIITLNNSSSGANTVYKTFDNSDIYAVVESNGTNRVSSTGTQFRTGRGITVDGFFTDGVTVTATFAEIDGNRAWASKYVNNVIRSASTPYVYTMSNEDFYKKLHIVLSSEGGESNNYYIAAVKNKSGTTILTQSSGQYIDVMDSRAEGSNTNGDNIKIAITKYSLKATYSNTAQSYANPDNSYNLDWLEVDGTLRIPSSWGLSSSDLDVDVANGWMYVNGTSGEKKQYEQYTRIAGSASSTRLGAVLSSKDGYDLCVTLRNQPTLVIGYFVSKDGEEIGTMAGLLIATEYFKNNFNAEGAKGYDFTQTLVPLSALNSNNVPADVFAKINSGDINTWEKLIEAVPNFNVAGYTFNEVTYKPIDLYYDMSSDIKVLEDKPNKTEQEQAYLDALISQRDSFELTYVALTEGGEETLQYVYWKAEEISENLSFKSFVLVNNIDAILTEEDMDMLKGAFGTNWGVGKTYLPNVVFAEVGSVVIFNGPVFDYTKDAEGNTVAFDGVFDGAGYTINHLTIAYNVDDSKSTHNVGMFAEVRGTGSQVTAVNLRNLNIQVIDTTASAKVINVGGVAGKFAASTVMEDVTVHGTISVKSTLGTVYAGGVIGSDSTGYVDVGVSKVIDGAIVVATVRAEGAIAVAGGFIGIMNEVNTTLTDVVSLSEVYAKGESTYANGFVGQYAKLVGGNASYNQDGIDYAPLNSTGKTSAYMNSVFEISVDGTYTRIAGGVSYDTLYRGSNSIFIESGAPDGYVVYPTSDQKDSKPESNTYDVINEYLAGSENNARESMRLRDIVDTYVLGYELTKTTVGEIATYAKSNTSKYVGTADGTADNRIGIAYQQHLNLIRMFNYMNFTLNRNVTMYTGYELRVIDEAFTGTIEANGHEVNIRRSESNKDFVNDADGTTYPQFFAYQDVNFTWLKKD